MLGIGNRDRFPTDVAVIHPANGLARPEGLEPPAL
jgi:hypothetical protein